MFLPLLLRRNFHIVSVKVPQVGIRIGRQVYPFSAECSGGSRQENLPWQDFPVSAEIRVPPLASLWFRYDPQPNCASAE